MIIKIYDFLFEKYGAQGWWPIISHNGSNPTKTGCVAGYHVKDYSYPRNEKERFEIIIGTVLTQNTSWGQVEKALLNLNKIDALNADGLLSLNIEELQDCIKPAGYFNQKSKYLRNIAKFFISLNGKVPTRDQLLSVVGVGNETADSILLYAYSMCEFVVDAYTKRILQALGLIESNASYMEIKLLFENSLQKDFKIYQEYHALLVEHAKRYYSKKPYGLGDFLKKGLNIEL